jgi:acyl carrier protein
MRDCIYSAFAHALTVRIPDEDVTYFKTVGDVADYICAVDPVADR